jgi:tripartite-type tricarboxylate transporter receptor subunit TctC
MKRAIGRCAAIAAVAVTLAGTSHAAAFPERPIRFVIPFPPGGSSDAIARLAAQRLSDSLGQQVVADNRGGASGIIGAEIVARAVPDGYTLLLAGITTNATIPHLHKNLPYEPVKSFAPISLLATAPNLVVVHPSVPAKSIKELVEFARANPNKISYASAGVGSPAHISGEMLRVLAKIQIVHVPYKGAGPALTDLIGGQVQLLATSPLSVLGHVKTGKLRALAITTKQRNPAFPDLPTVAEAVPGYELQQWWGIVATARTPPEIVNLLNRHLVAVLGTADIRQKLLEQGADAAPTTPAQMGTFMRSEVERFGTLIREAKITLE